ncbi:MAG: AAA family ATPase [Rhodobacteraceae bacterium]|nr:AAA family ATPase [Paracoccaceae bacterium]
MRIRAVRGQNLASLPKFEVDFDAQPLAGAGLFAITGPTGAGKSTLLDAICLALYDALPRLEGVGRGAVGRAGDAEAERISLSDVRSILRHGAGEGFAEVDFVGQDGKAYRARWSVHRSRKHASGRLQYQTHSLIDLDAETQVGHHRTEVKHEIARRIGLNFEQFRRAALLAQGDFDAFLRADAKDRAELLERITGSEIYAKISMAAFQRAKVEREEIKGLESDLSKLALLPPEARTVEESRAKAIDAQRAARGAALESVAAAARWSDERAVMARSAARTEQEATAATKGLEAVIISTAQSAQTAIDGAKAARAADVEWISARPALAKLADRVDEALATLRDHASARAALTQTEAARTQAATQAAELDQRAAALTQEAAQRGEAARAAETAAADAKTALETHDLDAATTRRKQLAAMQTNADRLREAARAGRQARGESEEAAAEATAAQGRAEAATKRLTELEAGASTLNSAVKVADGVLARLRAAGSDAAKSLRATLEPEQPCPVCGGTDHQAAAEVDAALRTQLQGAEQDAQAARAAMAESQAEGKSLAEQRARDRKEAEAKIKRAKAAEDRLAAARAAWRDGLATLTERLTELTPEDQAATSAAASALTKGEEAPEAALETFGVDLAQSMERAEQALEAANAARTRLQTALSTANTAAAAALEVGNRARETATRREALQSEVAKHDAARAASAERTQMFEARLDDWLGQLRPEWRGDDPEKLARSIAKKIDELKQRKQRLNELEQLTPSLIAFLEEITEKAPELVARAPAPADTSKSGALQTDMAAWREAARRGRAAVSTAEQDAAAARRAASGAAEALAEKLKTRPNLDTLATTPHVDEPTDSPIHTALGALTTAWAADDGELPRHLTSARQALERDRAALDQARDEVMVKLRLDDEARTTRAELDAKLASKRESAEVWLQLNELIGSEKGDKFRRYAQSLTLRQLVQLANQQLADLHPRYALEIPPGDGEDLALQAIDRDMGDEARGVQNLSGGERFLVSLALALGLASLSSERGVRVETLFIDEGFGALDPDSLSMAVSALEALQASGRRIGVISHVSELKERIAVKIAVEPQGGGRSRLRIEDAADAA